MWALSLIRARVKQHLPILGTDQWIVKAQDELISSALRCGMHPMGMTKHASNSLLHGRAESFASYLHAGNKVFGIRT